VKQTASKDKFIINIMSLYEKNHQNLSYHRKQEQQHCLKEDDINNIMKQEQNQKKL